MHVVRPAPDYTEVGPHYVQQEVHCLHSPLPGCTRLVLSEQQGLPIEVICNHHPASKYVVRKDNPAGRKDRSDMNDFRSSFLSFSLARVLCSRSDVARDAKNS